MITSYGYYFILLDFATFIETWKVCSGQRRNGERTLLQGNFDKIFVDLYLTALGEKWWQVGTGN